MKRVSTTLALLTSVVFAAGLMTTQSTVVGKGKPPKDGPPALYKVTLIENSFGGSHPNPLAMNTRGEIVGRADNADGVRLPFLYTTDAGMVNLNSLLTVSELDGWIIDSARDINESGQITGNARLDGGKAFAYLMELDPVEGNPRFMILPTPLGSVQTKPLGMNNFGDILLNVYYENSARYFVYADGVMIDLSGFAPRDINDSGQIIASTGPPEEVTEGGFRLTPNGNGGFTEEYFPDLVGRSINQFGEFTGEIPTGKGNGTICFRYSDDLEILMDGRKEVWGTGRHINNDGDVLLEGSRIYTDYNDLGLLSLEDLMDEKDKAIFSADYYWIKHSMALGERDATGLCPILIKATASIWEGQNNTAWTDIFLLTPIPTGN